MRRLLAVAACAFLSLTAAAAAEPTDEIDVTFVGDSVPASISYIPAARRELQRGLDVRLDLRECRRLVSSSCSFQGRAPTTALQAVQSNGHRLGDVLIVQVGHNEGWHGYGSGIDRVMRAARSQGANAVVWVTLCETRDIYHWTNRSIEAAAKRWPRLVVADWNEYSHGKRWFADDGLHLTPYGAERLASFLRPYVLRAAAMT